MAMLNSLNHLPKKGDIVRAVEISKEYNLATILTDNGSVTVHTFNDGKRDEKVSKSIQSGFYQGYDYNTTKILEQQLNIPKVILKLTEIYVKKYKGKSGVIEEYRKLQEICKKNKIKIQKAFDAVTAKNLLEENELRLKQNDVEFGETKKFMIDFLNKNLRIDVSEETHGFNGEHISIKLMLCNKEISDDMITTKHDDG